jgi:hypothetical protein
VKISRDKHPSGRVTVSDIAICSEEFSDDQVAFVGGFLPKVENIYEGGRKDVARHLYTLMAGWIRISA